MVTIQHKLLYWAVVIVFMLENLLDWLCKKFESPQIIVDPSLKGTVDRIKELSHHLRYGVRLEGEFDHYDWPDDNERELRTALSQFNRMKVVSSMEYQIYKKTIWSLQRMTDTHAVYDIDFLGNGRDPSFIPGLRYRMDNPSCYQQWSTLQKCMNDIQMRIDSSAVPIILTGTFINSFDGYKKRITHFTRFLNEYEPVCKELSSLEQELRKGMSPVEVI